MCNTSNALSINGQQNKPIMCIRNPKRSETVATTECERICRANKPCNARYTVHSASPCSETVYRPTPARREVANRRRTLSNFPPPTTELWSPITDRRRETGNRWSPSLIITRKSVKVGATVAGRKCVAVRAKLAATRKQSGESGKGYANVWKLDCA